MQKTKKIISIMLAILMIVTSVPFAFAADDYAVVDTEAGTVTIDGTLGGKTTATEDDVNALVEKLKGYVDSGITTIIVTGSEPALHDFYGIDTSAVSAALYYLADGRSDSPYCGTIDLILPEVTEIVDDEFNNTFALNSITLPMVTTVGDGAFYAARYLQTITFGSLVTSITQKNRVVFHMVGYDVGGCDLVLNCGQLQAEDTYKPDLENNVWFKPSWGGDVTWNSITLTHGDSEHTTATDNGDGTHSFTCTVCGGSVTKDHIGGEATCTTKAVCDLCGEEYGDIDANNHNFVNGTCLYCRNNKNIIGALSPQIRFQRNVDGSYADKFDVRTRASISDEDFTALVGATNSEATQNIKKVGFVYSINPDTFSIEDAKTVAKGGEIASYTDAPVKQIQDADGYYMFTCLVTDIPSTDTNYTLVSYAYICVEDADGNEKWYFMETQAEADFNSLYATYYPVACEKYGW